MISGLIQHQLKLGESYFQLTPIIQINILDFSFLDGESIVNRFLLKELDSNAMEILKKKPDLKNAFGVLEMYSSDPEKQREFEERLRADENYAYE
jgi:hypothetical protein